MQPAAELLTRPYNSRIIDFYLKLIRDKYPYIDTADLLSSAGMEAYEVADPGHWFDQDQVDRFYSRLVQMSRNPGIAREAGRYAAQMEAGNIFRPYIIGLLGPANAYGVLEKSSFYLTRSTSYKVKKLAANRVVVTVTPIGGIREKPYQCENRFGFMEAIGFIFNHKLPRIEHVECVFTGGSACVYDISWDRTATGVMRRVMSYLFLVLLVVNLLGFLVAPVRTRELIFPLSLFVGLVCSLAESRYQASSLRRSLKELQSVIEELVLQTRTNYNNTLLAYEVGQVMNSCTQVDEILDKVLRITERRLDYDRGLIMLATDDRRSLRFRAGFGYIEEYLSIILMTEFHLDRPESRGAFVVSFREQRPMLVNDIDQIEGDLSERSLDFARKVGSRSFICCPIVCDGESLGIIAVDNLSSKRPLLQSDMSMLMGVASVIGISLKNVRLIAAQQRQFRSMIQVLASSIDARDFLTAGHAVKVTEYAVGICKELDLEPGFQEMVRIAALLHDYGKIGVPDAVLKKKGTLTRDEFEIIKAHARKTREILDQIQFEGIYSQVPAIAAAHHERLDGTGYPDGLCGVEIPLGSRIIAVADFYEAITAKRHYRDPMSCDEAIGELIRATGEHLDPQVVEAFLRYLRKILVEEPVLLDARA